MPEKSSLSRNLRRFAGRQIRRFGLVPEGQPDGIGEDEALSGQVFSEQILFMFPDGPSNLYQVEVWLPTLEVLNTAMPTALVTQDSRVAGYLRGITNLRVYVIANYRTFETMADNGNQRLALYPAHHTRNFQYLRRTDFAHAYIGHGESDKAVSASGQMRAYDFVFIAGEAAKARARSISFFNPDERMIVVGRPQLAPIISGPLRNSPPTVLYAPTWEGAQPSMNYSSLTTMGEEIVSQLQAAGFLVVFRPHPRTGISDRNYATVAQRLQAITEPHQHNLIDDFNLADVLITDISSVVIDWLATERPVLVTNINNGEAEVTRLNPGSDIVNEVKNLLANPPDYSKLRARYVTEVSPNAFEEGCRKAIAAFEAQS